MPVSVKKTVKKTRSTKKQVETGLLDAIILGAQEKKAKDIVVMDLKSAGTNITDYFIVCHADSKIQVSAIAHSIEDEVFKLVKEKPVYKEGYANAEWILLDYINIVVHVFLHEQREYYGIERFWADAQSSKIA
ncbi:MAG: ribosome silencing factor [Bacteroidia bacterium]|jgi:ribosome-associated protein